MPTTASAQPSSEPTAACPRADHADRWRASARAVRRWARQRPHEYALIYGSPVPGYRAPADTIGPATRAAAAMARIVADAHAADALRPATPCTPLSPVLEGDLAAMAEFMGGAPSATAARAMRAWSTVFGLVSFELFGQFTNVLAHPGDFFDHTVTDLGIEIGLGTPKDLT